MPRVNGARVENGLGHAFAQIDAYVVAGVEEFRDRPVERVGEGRFDAQVPPLSTNRRQDNGLYRRIDAAVRSEELFADERAGLIGFDRPAKADLPQVVDCVLPNIGVGKVGREQAEDDGGGIEPDARAVCKHNIFRDNT